MVSTHTDIEARRNGDGDAVEALTTFGYRAIRPAWGSGASHSAFPRHEDLQAVLTDALQVFGVTKYRLGIMLGCGSHYVYNWFRGKRRMSALYSLRLAYLLLLHRRNVNIKSFNSLTWEGE